jgi:hypothetical protein
MTGSSSITIKFAEDIPNEARLTAAVFETSNPINRFVVTAVRQGTTGEAKKTAVITLNGGLVLNYNIQYTLTLDIETSSGTKIFKTADFADPVYSTIVAANSAGAQFKTKPYTWLTLTGTNLYPDDDGDRTTDPQFPTTGGGRIIKLTFAENLPSGLDITGIVTASNGRRASVTLGSYTGLPTGTTLEFTPNPNLTADTQYSLELTIKTANGIELFKTSDFQSFSPSIVYWQNGSVYFRTRP